MSEKTETRKRDLEKQKSWSKEWREKNPDKNKQLKIHSVKKDDLDLFKKLQTDENLTSSEAFEKIMGIYRSSQNN